MDQSPTVAGKRARKTVERLDISVAAAPATTSHKHTAEENLEAGSGVKLGDIEAIAHHIDKTKLDDLREIYRLCICNTIKVCTRFSS